MFKLDLENRGARDQIANIHWIIGKAREFQKSIYLCFIDYPKAFDCVDHNKLRKILQEMGIPDHLTCLLRNLYAGQEATVRTRHGTMDWLDLLAVQGTLKSLLQHHSSKVSILLCSDFFIVQLSHTYMTTGKTIALSRQTFVDKVTSLLFNMLSRLVITFLPRSKCLLISWLPSPSAVILEPPKMKVSHCFYCFPIYLP